MEDESLKVYYDALNRLIDNKPINVPKGSKINNDTVSLEAGRKRGSIKKSRESFSDLIEAIDNTKDSSTKELIECKKRLDTYKKKLKEYREKYEQALNRELMLVEQLRELEESNKVSLKNMK